MRWLFWSGVVLMAVVVEVMAGVGVLGAGDRSSYRVSEPSHNLKMRFARSKANPTEEVEVNEKENGSRTVNEENEEDTLKEEEKGDTTITEKENGPEEEEKQNITLAEEATRKLTLKKKKEKGKKTLAKEETGKLKLEEKKEKGNTTLAKEETGKLKLEEKKEKGNTTLAKEETGKLKLEAKKEKGNKTLAKEETGKLKLEEKKEKGKRVEKKEPEENTRKRIKDENIKRAIRRGLRLLPDSCACGKRSRKSYRVMFGEDAPLNAYPWMALLGFKDPDDPAWLCGGSLINERYVVSAAHCVHPVSMRRSHSDRLVKIRLGEHNLATDRDCPSDFIDAKECAEPPLDFLPEKVIIHEKYSLTTIHNDISLIRLDRKVKMSNSIQPVCLPPYDLHVAGFLGYRDAVVAGWGATEKDTQSNILQRAPIPLNSNKKCEDVYYVPLAKSQLCFGGRGKQDSCFGDSGGPIMQAKTGTGQYTLLGIVSYGKQICGIPGTPAVYTNVSYFRTWILQTIKP